MNYDNKILESILKDLKISESLLKKSQKEIEKTNIQNVENEFLVISNGIKHDKSLKSFKNKKQKNKTFIFPYIMSLIENSVNTRRCLPKQWNKTIKLLEQQKVVDYKNKLKNSYVKEDFNLLESKLDFTIYNGNKRTSSNSNKKFQNYFSDDNVSHTKSFNYKYIALRNNDFNQKMKLIKIKNHLKNIRSNENSITLDKSIKTNNLKKIKNKLIINSTDNIFIHYPDKIFPKKDVKKSIVQQVNISPKSLYINKQNSINEVKFFTNIAKRYNRKNDQTHCRNLYNSSSINKENESMKLTKYKRENSILSYVLNNENNSNKRRINAYINKKESPKITPQKNNLQSKNENNTFRENNKSFSKLNKILNNKNEYINKTRTINNSNSNNNINKSQTNIDCTLHNNSNIKNYKNISLFKASTLKEASLKLIKDNKEPKINEKTVNKNNEDCYTDLFNISSRLKGFFHHNNEEIYNPNRKENNNDDILGFL